MNNLRSAFLHIVGWDEILSSTGRPYLSKRLDPGQNLKFRPPLSTQNDMLIPADHLPHHGG